MWHPPGGKTPTPPPAIGTPIGGVFRIDTAAEPVQPEVNSPGTKSMAMNAAGASSQTSGPLEWRTPGVPLAIVVASTDELRQHEAMLDLIQKASDGKVLWRPGLPADEGHA